MEKLNPTFGEGVSSMPSTKSSQERLNWIAERGKKLFGCYRADQVANPREYVKSVCRVLEDYPDEVVFHITDDKTGIQRACKWPPTINEIVCACEVQVQHMAKLARLQNWGKNEVPALEAPREDRPTYEELKAKYGENFGLDPTAPSSAPKFKAPSWQGIVSMYQAEPGRLQRLLKAADDQHPEDLGDAPC